MHFRVKFYVSFICVVVVIHCPGLLHAENLINGIGKSTISSNSDSGKCNIHAQSSQSSKGIEPHILFTDILSGPAEGGEDDQGAYLSVYGFNFGDATDMGVSTRVCINNIEVAAYKHMGSAVSQFAQPHKKLQKITVQVGSLNNSLSGVELPLHIEVNGLVSKQAHTFTIQPGDIYFVDNVNGNDETGEKNNPLKPFRHVQTSSKKKLGVTSHIKPGDFIVMRGNAVWNDIGRGNRFLRFRHISGSKPTGTVGNGPITLMAYPGEDVLIQCQDDSSCGIHGVDGYSDKKYEVDSDWITISNIRIRGGGPKVKDGPINLQHKSDNWRIVNNELFDWDANDEDDKLIDGVKYRDARSGGITGDGKNIKIFGNYIHDIGGGTRNHGIYIDGGAENVEIAFNHLEKLTGGNIIQTYDSVGFQNGLSRIKNIEIHHNLMSDTSRYGINIADGTVSAVISNNLIYDTAYAGIRFSTESSRLIHISHNTFNNVCSSRRNKKYAAINNDWLGDDITFVNNIVIGNDNCASYFYSATKSSGFVLDNNIYYGLSSYGLDARLPDREKKGISADPKFLSVSGGDFRLQRKSKAINVGIKTIRQPVYDFLMNFRDSRPDIGAFEYLNK